MYQIYQVLFTIIVLFCAYSPLLAQKNIPIVQSTSTKTYFTEGDTTIKHNWWLDPSYRPDVYVTDKDEGEKWFDFHTDIDGLRMKLAPGQHFDFVVLLNGKDSCYTKVVYPAPITEYVNQFPATHDTIPFELTPYNNIKISTILNGSDTLDLKFDSGTTGLIVTHDAIANKTNLLADLPEGSKTKDYVPIGKNHTLQIGALQWDSLTLYPVTLSGQGTDGRFGWDLFDGRIVEIDYDKNILIVHSSLPQQPMNYAQLKIKYINTLFCIQGNLMVNNRSYPNRFLFDTGYQRALLLDSVLMERQNFPKDLTVLKVNELRNGAGKIFRTKIVETDRLLLNQTYAANIPTQLLNTGNPARFPIHILGNELLKRFNTILDFQGNYIYLKPNSLFNVDYVDG